MAKQGPETPAVLREQVTSKGGTTEAALKHLEAHNVRRLFQEALTAACERSAQLASELGKGTLFTLRIPLAIPPDSDTSPLLAGEVAATAAGEGSATSPAVAGEVAAIAAGEGSATSPAAAGEVARMGG